MCCRSSPNDRKESARFAYSRGEDTLGSPGLVISHGWILGQVYVDEVGIDYGLYYSSTHCYRIEYALDKIPIKVLY